MMTEEPDAPAWAHEAVTKVYALFPEIEAWERGWSAAIREECKHPRPINGDANAAALVAALGSLSLPYTCRRGVVVVHLDNRGEEVLADAQLRLSEALRARSPKEYYHLDRRVFFLPRCMPGSPHGAKGCGQRGSYWELSGSEIQEVARSMDAETARRFLDSDIVVCSDGPPRRVCIETKGWPPPPYDTSKKPGDILRVRREPVSIPLEGGLLIDQLDPYWCPYVTRWESEVVEFDGLFYSLARYAWHYTSWARIGG